MRFAECMRENGVREFPDPDASGELTIDGVVNGSSLDTSTAAWKGAIGACKDLEPSGFTGHKRSSEQQSAALEFAQCIRENGVTDFPDPTAGAPLVDTNRIPSSSRPGGMDILNAAMRTCGDDSRVGWGWGAGEAADVAGGRDGRPGCRGPRRAVVVVSDGEETTAAAPQAPANTAKVEKGRLSAVVSLSGILSYRSPYVAP